MNFHNKLEHLSLSNIRPGWKRLARDKRSSLLQKFLSYACKMFMKLIPGSRSWSASRAWQAPWQSSESWGSPSISQLVLVQHFLELEMAQLRNNHDLDILLVEITANYSPQKARPKKQLVRKIPAQQFDKKNNI